VQELVARGASLEATSNNGYTPLHMVCAGGHLDVVQELVARGAFLFTTASDGKTAFDSAFDKRHNNVVDYLLRAYGEKVTAREGLQAIHSVLQAATFLHVAAHPPQDPTLDLPPTLSLQVQLPLGNLTLDQFQTLLLLLPRNSFHSQDYNGQLPLHIACRVGAPLRILALLALAYAPALQTTACQADAPLLVSIFYVVEQDPNAVQAANNDGALPLHLLCGSKPSVQAVQYLLGLFEGALAMTTHHGDLPLMVACKTAVSESVIQILLTRYPDALIYMQEYYDNSRR